MTLPNPHAVIDAANRDRDRALAELIRKKPTVIARAQQNLRDWDKRWGGLNPAWQEWDLLLRMLTPSQIADFLESATPKSERLRQSSPFLGILDDDRNRDAA